MLMQEEKDRLQKELDVLNEKMLELQRRALNLAAEGEGDQSVEETITSRNVLCHLLRRQQLEFATIRKLVSESTASVSSLLSFS
jgi:ABC-type Zn uptake system ZnuABC Zn-binding protein ZnuA